MVKRLSSSCCQPMPASLNFFAIRNVERSILGLALNRNSRR